MSAGLRLTINLDRLSGNWRRLAAVSAPAECAAAVKADAYGTGIAQTVPALLEAGCRIFFVAVPEEGIAVRRAAPDATVYVLNGFFSECAGLYRQHRLMPVLGNPDELKQWSAWRRGENAALHVDTGMNRLGLSAGEAELIGNAELRAAGIGLVMSHLACADTPAHPLNGIQLDRFGSIAARFAGLPASLANSAGIHFGRTHHFDIVRPGIALYGGASHPDARSDPVVTAEARILQIRSVAKGETIGYGGAQTLQRDSRIAILSAGYGDGYLRSAWPGGAQVSLAGHPAPLAGRVSMDLIAADVTDIPELLVERAGWAELFGETLDINRVAANAGTIAYELLTGLSRRAERIYIGAGAKS